MFVLVLAVAVVLVGCDASDSQGGRAGEERGSEKAAKDKRPGSGAGIKEAKPSDSGSDSSPAGAQYSTGPEPDEVLASQYEHVNA